MLFMHLAQTRIKFLVDRRSCMHCSPLHKCVHVYSTHTATIFQQWWTHFVSNSNPKIEQDIVGKTDFAPGTATWRTRRNIHIRDAFDSSLFLHYMKTWHHPQNENYIAYCTAIREHRAAATGNMYRTFGEIWMCGFWDMQADTWRDRQTKNKQTDRHTDMLSTILCTLSGAK